MINKGKEYFLPFILTAVVVILDQITKAIIVIRWPLQGTIISDVFDNDFLLIYHVRNKALAFSLGDNLPDPFRFPLFVVVPFLVLGFLVWYYFKTDEFTRSQRWAIAGIIGGGLGNLICRVFRPDGVVDFISVKFFGIFGFERWPTFNVADSSVVVCCIFLIVTMLIPEKKEPQPEPSSESPSQSGHD